jgi:hypothetical protein
MDKQPIVNITPFDTNTLKQLLGLLIEEYESDLRVFSVVKSMVEKIEPEKTLKTIQEIRQKMSLKEAEKIPKEKPSKECKVVGGCKIIRLADWRV